jgi:hypothetical protein
MWTVRLIEAPKLYIYRSDYFPRTMRYKKDALKLLEEVKRQGGKAILEKSK